MNTGSSTTANYSANSGLVESRCEVNFETGTNESCTSLSWNPYEEDLLLAGMNGKLKIYDTRSSEYTNFIFIFLIFSFNMENLKLQTSNSILLVDVF